MKRILSFIIIWIFLFCFFVHAQPPLFPSAYPSKLLQTDQTTKYHNGDDGDLELGVTKSYKILSTGQYSGTSNIVINGKTHAMSNACVQDNRTGLMWARYVATADIGSATDGRLFWTEYTVTDTDISFVNATSKIHRAGGDWVVAALCVGRIFTIAGTDSNDGTYTVTAVDVNDITVAEALTDEIAGDTVIVTSVGDLIWDMLDQANANSLGGHADWRVPNVYELVIIVNYGNCWPSIDTTTFPSTPTENHWTASTYPCDSAGAFYVYFGYGGVVHDYKEQNKYYVRLVRG